MQRAVVSLFFTFSFVLLSTVTCQDRKEDFVCKRLVTEQHRCKVYNYRHPLCKKWDHSHCPPPRIIRDYSQCVSYKCKPRQQEEWEVQSATTLKTKPPIAAKTAGEQGRKDVEEGEEEREDLSGLKRPDQIFVSHEAEFARLREEIEALRRVNSF